MRHSGRESLGQKKRRGGNARRKGKNTRVWKVSPRWGRPRPLLWATKVSHLGFERWVCRCAQRSRHAGRARAARVVRAWRAAPRCRSASQHVHMHAQHAPTSSCLDALTAGCEKALQLATHTHRLRRLPPLPRQRHRLVRRDCALCGRRLCREHRGELRRRWR